MVEHDGTSCSLHVMFDLQKTYWHQTATVSVFVQISLQTFLFKSFVVHSCERSGT